MNRQQKIGQLLLATCPVEHSVAEHGFDFSQLKRRARRADTGSALLDFVLIHAESPEADVFIEHLKETGHSINRVGVADCPSDYRDLPDRQHPVVYTHTTTLYACFVRYAGLIAACDSYERAVDQVFQWLHAFRRQYQIRFAD